MNLATRSQAKRKWRNDAPPEWTDEMVTAWAAENKRLEAEWNKLGQTLMERNAETQGMRRAYAKKHRVRPGWIHCERHGHYVNECTQCDPAFQTPEYHYNPAAHDDPYPELVVKGKPEDCLACILYARVKQL